MAKIEILRSEGENLPGHRTRIVLLPADRVTGYDPVLDFVSDVDFELVSEFEPKLCILEATPLSVTVATNMENRPSGSVHNHTVTLKVPGDERFTQPRLKQMVDIRYFIAFIADLNTTESDFRWKVFGTKENPMVLNYTGSSSPRQYVVTLQNSQSGIASWYDPEAIPEDDLG